MLRPAHIGTGHCSIDRSSGVFGISCAAGAGERGGHIAHIGDRDRHGLRDGVGVIGLGGGNDDVVNIAAGRAGWGLKVGAALPANHPAAAVDAELGRVGPTADAV